ncbi:hypothetical protein HY992_03940 [Candidatus Micrarchaeota archaeon]|nr:hypothetical protein [Candidatus Micrarchaeota archaeon]
MDSLEELAVLLLAEGNVRLHHGYEVQFTNTDEAMQKLFSSLVAKLGFEVKRKSSKQLVVYSKKLALSLFALSNSYRTKSCKSGKANACKSKSACLHCKRFFCNSVSYPCASFPKAAFSNPAKALQLFFSCDGGVVQSTDGKSNEVIVRVCHPILKSQVKQMLSSLSIKFGERGNGLIYVKRLAEIKKFRELIGFIENACSSRSLNKTSKNARLLEIISNSPSVHTARQVTQAIF